MTEIVDLSVYQTRAANLEKPEGYQELVDAVDAAFATPFTATVNSFFADISEFQSVVNAQYPYGMISCRADSGYRSDYHIAQNWSFCKNNPKIQVFLSYVVFIPGQLSSVLARLKQTFGAVAPKKLAIMIDMESGSGFAGPGNHSTEANQWVSQIGKWLGSTKRVVGYANHYDFVSNWPTRPPGLKLITASYGMQDPGSWGWQYYGGMVQYGAPAGYPRTCAPFGSYVDMNVIHKTLAQIEVDLGLTATPHPAVQEDEMRIVKDATAQFLPILIGNGPTRVLTSVSEVTALKAAGIIVVPVADVHYHTLRNAK